MISIYLHFSRKLCFLSLTHTGYGEKMILLKPDIGVTQRGRLNPGTQLLETLLGWSKAEEISQYLSWPAVTLPFSWEAKALENSTADSISLPVSYQKFYYLILHTSASRVPHQQGQLSIQFS